MPTTRVITEKSVPSALEPAITAKSVSPSQWKYITREAAAERLGVTVRTVDRYIQAGHLKIKRGKGTRQRANLVHEGDIDKLREVKDTPFAVIRGPEKLAPAPLLPVAVEQVSETWITIESASKRSGLPAAYLERIILRGELPARNVLEGTQASGASWRIHCADLDALRGVVCIPG